MSDVELASRLRAQGLPYREVAERCGVTTTTVYRWLNPAYAERERRVSLDAKRRRQTSCPSCGCQVDYTRPGQLCNDCKHERDFGDRNRRIVAAWQRGESGTLIGEREGLDCNAVNSLVHTWRVRGHYGVERHTRSQHELWDRIEAMWAEGATLQQIADRTGTTRDNIGQMVGAMRRAGRNVPYRRPSRAKH